MTTTKQITLAEFIEQHGITKNAQRIAGRPDRIGSEWDAKASHWSVTLYRGGHVTGKGPEVATMSVCYSMGSAHTNPPTASEVLDSLKMDASSAEQTFEDWCAECGEDEDSRKAERTYFACRDIAAKLRAFLTADQFAQLMECESL